MTPITKLPYVNNVFAELFYSMSLPLYYSWLNSLHVAMLVYCRTCVIKDFTD